MYQKSNIFNSIILIATTSLLSVFISCGEIYFPGELAITKVKIELKDNWEYLDIPHGTVLTLPPNFNINNPATWTGELEQYVDKTYRYEVSYTVENKGRGIAYDAEIDLTYHYDQGDSETETIFLGEIRGDSKRSSTVTLTTVNKKLIECSGEVFWYE
ncbi:MAG: hypothetical protein AAFQ94_06715 [Bacteroidota bacterium]